MLGHSWSNFILQSILVPAQTDAGLHFRENGRMRAEEVGEGTKARKSGNVEL